MFYLHNRIDFSYTSYKISSIFRSVGGRITSNISLNGEEQFVLFDSGSGDVYSPQTKRAKRIPKDQRLSFEGIFSFGLSQGKIKSEKRYRSLVAELKIGGGTLRDFHSQFSKLTSARMGAGILHYGQVSLDYQKQRF